MNKNIVRRVTLKKIVLSVLCLVTLLLVTLSLIPVKQPKGEVKQKEYSSVLRYLTSKVYLSHVARQEKNRKAHIEKNLLTTIQEQAGVVTCFPIELVICNRTIHEDYDLARNDSSTKPTRNKFHFWKKTKTAEHIGLYNTINIKHRHRRLFYTDRYLDLTFERYLPLSRIISKANGATKEDIQLCLDYLPDSTPRERALIFVSFYIYIEKLYKDGTHWGDQLNRLDKKTEQFVNELLRVMQENAESVAIAFNANQTDLNELALQWQVSFRRLFWNLISDSPWDSVFLTDATQPWIEVTLDSPDTFLYSLALVHVNTEMRKAHQEYNKGTSLYLRGDSNKLNEIFTSRTDTPLSYLKGFGSCEYYEWYRTDGSYTRVPDPRIESALFYPQRTEILANYTDLLLPEENLVDEAREYLLAQFFFQGIGHMRRHAPGLVLESYNDVANQDDMTVGEIATRLLDEVDFITTPVNLQD